MKLVTYRCTKPAGPPRVGALLDCQPRVLDLQAACQASRGDSAAEFENMLSLLDAGDAAIDESRRLQERAEDGDFGEHTAPQDAIALESPVLRPRSIRDGMAFEQHVIQAARTIVGWHFRPLAMLDSAVARVLGRGLVRPPRAWYDQPLYYKGNTASVVGHNADVIWPAYTERLDFELEFGAFIGRQGADIPEAKALDHVAGYAIFNDFSARDVQVAEMKGRLGPAKSKDFDTGNAIGPWLVTRDSVPDPHRLAMTARVNGETWTVANSSDMHYSFEEIISYISRSETLMPGDFIAAGTAPGGCGLELDRWLQPNDSVELEVERLGVLRNRVVRLFR